MADLEEIKSIMKENARNTEKRFDKIDTKLETVDERLQKGSVQFVGQEKDIEALKAEDKRTNKRIDKWDSTFLKMLLYVWGAIVAAAYGIFKAHK